ncbi:MAG: BLUF domain-containing protein [Ekhidna sp.]|nr:BLUF domain-containing protein [Ekhidna sp.]
MALHRLIYKSKRAESTTDADIQDILKACERHNPKADISGVLVHSNNSFFQYLEGKKEYIESLYDKIKTDPRHYDCELELLEPIDQKVFPSWNMGYKDIDTSLVEFNTEVAGKELLELEKLIYGSNEMDDKGIAMLHQEFE